MTTACTTSGTISLSARPISSDERAQRGDQHPLVRAGLDLEQQVRRRSIEVPNSAIITRMPGTNHCHGAATG